MIIIRSENIKKTFNRRIVFDKVNFEISSKDGLGIIGKNGSGKTTLIKVIAGLFEPSAGKIKYYLKEKQVASDEIFKHIGYVAPYLNLYDEFTALENLIIFDKIRNLKNPPELYKKILEKVNLLERKDDYLRTFSSGMKQRLKFAFAIIGNPDILILDEPSTNLDPEGIKMMNIIIQEYRFDEKMVIIATNDAEDLTYCNYLIDLNKK
jgi:heme exporter protein A